MDDGQGDFFSSEAVGMCFDICDVCIKKLAKHINAHPKDLVAQQRLYGFRLLKNTIKAEVVKLQDGDPWSNSVTALMKLIMDMAGEKAVM